MKKLPKIKTIKTKAWKALSKYVRTRDKWCVTCLVEGKREPSTQACHFRHNGDKPNNNLGGNELWYFEKNIHGGCSSCNLYKNGNLASYAVYLQQTYDSSILSHIQALWQTPKKWSRDEIAEVQKYYEDKLEKL